MEAPVADALGFAERVRLVIDLLQFVGFGVMIGVAIAQMRATTKQLEQLSSRVDEHLGDSNVHVDAEDMKRRVGRLEDARWAGTRTRP